MVKPIVLAQMNMDSLEFHPTNLSLIRQSTLSSSSITLFTIVDVFKQLPVTALVCSSARMATFTLVAKETLDDLGMVKK